MTKIVTSLLKLTKSVTFSLDKLNRGDRDSLPIKACINYAYPHHGQALFGKGTRLIKASCVDLTRYVNTDKLQRIDDYS